VWALIAKVLVTLMNTNQMRVKDLMQVTMYISTAKVRSDKLYKFITRYLMKVGFDESTQATINPDLTIFFLLSLAKACPALKEEGSEAFFEVFNVYLQAKVA